MATDINSKKGVPDGARRYERLIIDYMKIRGIKQDTHIDVLQLTGIPTTSEPPKAPADCGAIYYNKTTQKFMFSSNGGAYVALTLP